MGGGGFTMEPDNPALDDFILTLSDAREPRVLFLPTASGDPEAHIARFHAAFSGRSARLTALSLFRLVDGPVPVRDLLLSQDIIYVGGGSMRALLALWREYGLDAILREAWESGVVLAGLSAGAMCWFHAGVTKSTGVPRPVDGLGFLPGSLCVHYDGQPERRPVYLDAIRAGAVPGGWAADDGVGLLFDGVDGNPSRVVASRPGARAFRVARHGDHVVETQLAVEVLAEAEAIEDRPVPFAIRELRELRRSGPG